MVGGSWYLRKTKLHEVDGAWYLRKIKVLKVGGGWWWLVPPKNKDT